MIAYLDTSVILRIVLREENPLAEWDQLITGITSSLTKVESARSLNRLAFRETLDADGISEKRQEAADILQRLDLIPMDEQILGTASAPWPFILGTLDAIHLASALHLRASGPATHDRALAAAARAVQFDVIGVAA